MPLNQYGYAQAPGSGMGYYEQQTPVGSFVATDPTRVGQAQYAGQQQVANNPYLGMSSANGATSAGQASVASNPYFGSGNPYTAQAVNAASDAAMRNYNQGIAPQRDAQMARSGSFGNSGVQQMQLEDQRNLQGTLGNIANNAYMQDLFRQQDMGESAANRQTSNSQFNVGARANDLNRNLMAGQFDASLAGQMGMFNAGQGNQMSMFNAGQGNQVNMFDAGQANAAGMFNAGQGNNMINSYLNRNQQGDQFNRNLATNQDQFNQGMDFQTWQANNNNMRNGNIDQMNMLNMLLGWQQGGVNAATNTQNTPLNYYQQFVNHGTQLGGMGGTNTQNLQGNPWLTGLGGAMTGGNIYNRLFGG